MKKLLCASLILVAFFVCKKNDDNNPPVKDVIDLLPVDNEISGWTKSSALQIAENATQLFDLIDGEGQPYVDDGFVKYAIQKYSGDISGTPVTLKLRIADMVDTANACKIYNDVATGTEVAWTDQAPGVEARIDAVPGYYYRIDFWDDKFHVWVEINDGTDPSLNIAKLFALNISQAIRDTTSASP
jgi:hypothetical protein